MKLLGLVLALAISYYAVSTILPAMQTISNTLEEVQNAHR